MLKSTPKSRRLLDGWQLIAAPYPGFAGMQLEFIGEERDDEAFAGMGMVLFILAPAFVALTWLWQIRIRRLRRDRSEKRAWAESSS